jgi:hypothetical protein
MTTCQICGCVYQWTPVQCCPWCWCLARLADDEEQAETLALLDMLIADRERRQREYEEMLVRKAYWLGRQMARYEVTKAQALTRIEQLARAYWDDICTPCHITPRGIVIGMDAFTRGVEEGQHGRRAA